MRRSVFRGQLGASGVFLVLSWTMLEKVHGVGTVRRWLYLAAEALRVNPGRRYIVLSL
jgi:hypothetical protein